MLTRGGGDTSSAHAQAATARVVAAIRRTSGGVMARSRIVGPRGAGGTHFVSQGAPGPASGVGHRGRAVRCRRGPGRVPSLPSFVRTTLGPGGPGGFFG